MAVIWQQRIDGKHYEVRSAGATRRLYTGGVCHSQYNPKRPLTGAVWDLLMLPAFFYPPGNIHRVLVLGVGGGAVIAQLHRFVGPRCIVGVELDPVHIRIARRFFGIGGDAVALHAADARAWVEDYHGPKFDLIIDDLYGDEKGEPVRAVPATVRWWDALLQHLSPEGALVVNFVSLAELTRSAFFHSRRMARRFPAAFRFTLHHYDNAVGAFLRREATSMELHRNLAATPGLNPNLKTSRLRYRMARIQAL